MRYRILLSVDVNANNDRQAADWAKKLGDLLKNPLVTMSIEGEGIRVDGQPQVYQPQRAR